jgi:uncharacterized protein (UPF0297 family)
MNDRQQAKLNMFQSVSETCHSNEQAYAGVPAFANAVQQLDDNLAAIDRHAQQQSGVVPQGVSAEKIIAAEILTQESVKTANSIYVYAFNAGDQKLLSKVSVNKSMFYNGHYNDSLIMAKNISTEAHNRTSELQEYGIDETAIKALDEAITAFEQVINKPHAAISERKLHTGNLKQLFAETDSTLYDRLDKLVTLFKTSDPDFYTLYKNARNVIDTAKRSKKKEEEVKE